MPALTLDGQTRQRQIVILAIGLVALAGLLVFQVPRTLDMLKSDAPASAPPTATTTPVTPPASPATPPPAAPGTSVRTASLTQFTSKDPFVQQIGQNTGAPSAAPAPGAAPSTSAPSGSTAEAGSFRTVGSSSPSSADGKTATIAVNGAEDSVAVSDTFPEGNPVFKLVSLGPNTAKVGVASGSLKGGSQTVTLSKGEPLTLLNTVDGKRYKLELVALPE
jgi:hypothetical protein